MANHMIDSIEKPLRAAYIDAVRKDLVPGMGKSLDKLFSDTRDIIRDGINDGWWFLILILPINL